MSDAIEVRLCICGALSGRDLTVPLAVDCYLCKAATIFVIPEEDGWRAQHGPNPEHRSTLYQGTNLMAFCDWIDEVHDRAAIEATS